MKRDYYHTYEQIEGTTAIVLGYKAFNKNTKDIIIKIAPELGNNLYCFKIGEYEVVHYDPKYSLTSYYTANPILYPIPNRLRNCMYEFKGKKHWQQKKGIPVFLHSLIYDESWKSNDPVVSDDGIELETYLVIDENHPVYEGFPFKHTLKIFYKLNDKGFSIRYELINQGNEELPYGISYHTFFSKLGDDDKSRICVPADYMMELTDDLLPTGQLLPVENQNFDLRKPVSVGSLDLDNCFTGMRPDERVFIEYENISLRVYMDATDDFTHMQVFTPKGKPFFCVEKQTCSTDAPNLDAQGFSKEAHLLTVLPEMTVTGIVDFVYGFYK